MAGQSHAPYASQDIEEVASLLKSLEQARVKKGRSKVHCKKSTFPVHGVEGVSVDSWRFQDWDYKRPDLPTYARGLFSYRRKDGTPEIAIRGYDKFFNVEEVSDTRWENVEKSTKGPYELSVKENGCIIFISGLEGDKLLVCSKHSTGPRQDVNLSHAVAGERHVDMHLAAVGKSRADLARELRNRNATAVAELCDDSFEEHVLAYDQKTAGLYLHGINLNLPGFATYPGKLVHAFADDWGFKKAEYLIKDDIETVKAFLEECAQTGSWNGRDTEGFVIRCHKRLKDSEALENWFFKFKFEEPYLMYRQWREVTKATINGKTPRYKKHKQITEEYLNYARRQLAKDPQLGKAFNANHGIIAMRDGFLQERGLKGSDIIRQEQDESPDDVTNNVVLVPVASIGCGKTTVAVALAKLFGWGHVQNDNITGSKGRPKQFATLVCSSLAAYPVMIADRNNHQKRERKQIMDDVRNVIHDARFVALHYVHDRQPEVLSEIRRVTRERVLARGDNHQTIQAGTKSQRDIIAIMDGFLDRFEAVDPHEDPDDGFDQVIDLDISADSRENLGLIVSSLGSCYPKLFDKMPTSRELDVAIQAALNDYQPDIKHDLSFKSNKSKDKNTNKSAQASAPAKTAKVEYFCIRLPTKEILSTLERLFAPLSAETTKLYKQLQQSRRLQPTFHVTLVHRASISQHSALWEELCTRRNTVLGSSTSPKADPSADPVLGKCQVHLERVIWDQRVMCIVVRLLDEGWRSINSVAHTTVGTASSDIKPYESNRLLEKWLEVGSGGETGIEEVEINGSVDLQGTVQAVMQGKS
ncbi:hypothetical protein MMC07_000288 [Pseudocyphellaria aurata]|nr:hypothetical protein [Pseudocyphellaria aurata]